jgi:hypothetical protein
MLLALSPKQMDCISVIQVTVSVSSSEVKLSGVPFFNIATSLDGGEIDGLC